MAHVTWSEVKAEWRRKLGLPEDAPMEDIIAAVEDGRWKTEEDDEL